MQNALLALSIPKKLNPHPLPPQAFDSLLLEGDKRLTVQQLVHTKFPWLGHEKNAKFPPMG